MIKRSSASGVGVPDFFGALSLGVGIAALVWAIVEIPSRGSSATKIVVAVLLAVVAIGLTVRRSRRHHTPAIDLVAVRVVPMWASCVALVLFSAGFGAILLGNVMFLTSVWHQAPAIAGLSLSLRGPSSSSWCR